MPFHPATNFRRARFGASAALFDMLNQKQGQ
jgi:hypothetical protein